MLNAVWLIHNRLNESKLQEDTGKLYRQAGQAKSGEGGLEQCDSYTH